MKNFNIEIVADKTDNANNEKGNLLEKIVAELLGCMDYSVDRNIRVTGMEIDVLAIHNKTNDKILCECKAQKENISANIISQLLGDRQIFNASSTMLFHIADLGKEAKGVMVEWEKKPQEEKRLLSLYNKHDIINLLIRNKKIVSNDSLPRDNNKQYSDDILVFYKNEIFWCCSCMTDGVPSSVFVFNAENGDLVTNKIIVDKFQNTDISIANLNWDTSLTSIQTQDEDIKKAVENVVAIKSADSWDDYRPSRPEDFVGRECTIKDIIEHVLAVANNKTKTRIVGLSAPSGFGKSSLIVKLISKTKSKKYNKNIFAYAVDTRAAISDRYAEFAFLKCLKEAQADGFIKFKGEILLGNINNILDSQSIREIINELEKNNKAILLFFDQFEELFSKDEMLSLFSNFKSFLNSCDSVEKNIIIGVSWKTDTTVPASHPAYNIWHNLSDRRKDFKITIFNSNEISKVITRLSKQIGQKIEKRLSKYLSDSCQGYPWLLKKLCIHVYHLIQEGKEQDDILVEKLNISKLFDEELHNLSGEEIVAVEYIANKAPINFAELISSFDPAIIQSLINKRICIRSGSNVSLYWDIFREYVKTRNTPVIHETYIPCSSISAIFNAIVDMSNGKDIKSISNLTNNSIDNLIRDLIMMGCAKKEKESLVLLNKELDFTKKMISKFWNEHIVFEHIKNKILQSSTKTIPYEDIEKVCEELYGKKGFKKQTITIYLNKFLQWLLNIKLIKKQSNVFALGNSNEQYDFDLLNIYRRKSNNDKTKFLAPTGYEQVEIAIDMLLKEEIKEDVFKEKKLRNAILILCSFQLAYKENGYVKLNFTDKKDLIKKLFEFVKNTQEIRFIDKIYKENKNISGKEIGAKINEYFSYNWKPASELRVGNSLFRWYRLLFNIDSV